jgi:hypothetical protein
MTYKNYVRHILLIAVFIQSCDLSGKKESSVPDVKNFKNIKVGGKYEISLPPYFSEAKQLNEVASLQYQNIYRETYIVCIDEIKEEFTSLFRELNRYDSTQSLITNYRLQQIANIAQGVTFLKQSKVKKLQINGMPAEFIELYSKAENDRPEIYYQITFIEGENHVYMIMAWTLPDREKRYSEEFRAIVKTFKEIKPDENTEI